MELQKIRDDFDRLALFDDDGWSHNSHYGDYLLRHIPAGSGHAATALEIGCGTGHFARQLAARYDRVIAVDPSPQMIRVAQARSGGFPNIEYQVGEVMAMAFPAGSFDCIASIATLHHLPLPAVLQRMKEMLKPGGVLLALDLFEAEAQRLPDLLRSAVALRLLRLRTSPAARAAWAEHGRTDRYVRVSDVRQLCRDLLPGAVVRKHLFWRYSLVWRKPAQ